MSVRRFFREHDNLSRGRYIQDGVWSLGREGIGPFFELNMMNQQRALRQYIEDWQRAGLDRLAVSMPSVVAQADDSATVVPPPATDLPPKASSVAHKPAQTPPPVVPKQVVPKQVVADLAAPAPRLEPAVPPVVAKTTSSPVGPRTDRTIIERVAALQVLAGACAACTKCAELADSRTQTVFGVGNPSASIMFVGEAPGADEDRLGEPFVGAAGQMLDKIIGACKLKREEIYICNVLRCRPPGNRNPTPDEAANCREFLDGQIDVVDPDYIVCWGGVAAQNLLGVVSSVGKLRGTIHQHGRAKVVCTYHPSYLLRNPSAKKQVWDDMKLLFADMGVQL